MNLHRLLEQRAADGRPLRVALIGAGKFGSMFLAQARRTPGIHIVAVADLVPQRARDSLARAGWEKERYSARSFDEGRNSGTTCVTDDATAAIASDAVEIVIDATGSPAAGIRHALACCRHGKHIVMVNVEADCLAGPLLARSAREAGIVYSLAYGDQPALICEMADWARAAGFEVVSSLERDGRPVARDLRWGVYITFAADSEYVKRCFAEYGLVTDDSGNYAAMYKPYHLIGLELGISVASIGLRGEPTGAPSGFRGDAVAIAKRDLKEGETLDGEGGYTVWGKLMPARDSLARGGLPIGIAHGVRLTRPVEKGATLTWRDIILPETEAARVRLEMEALFAAEWGMQRETA